jgi:hypothetical protein
MARASVPDLPVAFSKEMRREEFSEDAKGVLLVFV